MSDKDIKEIKQEIEAIKEYLETELCKKCDEMFKSLQQLEQLLQKYDATT